jgi:maleylpyruvate isomerase
MWIHAVDLDAGASFADMPRPMVDALLLDACEAMGRKPECPVLRLVDGDRQWHVGDAEKATAVVVTGEAAELAAWFLGRSKGKVLRADGARKLPALPPWL